MVVTRFASQLFFAGSVLVGLSPAFAENLELDIAKGPLQELLATTDVQQQVLNDRLDSAFSDMTEGYGGSMEFAVGKTFPSENWDISLVSAKSADGTFQRFISLFSNSDEGIAPTFCQDVNSLLVSELGEPNVTLDVSRPLPNDTIFMSSSRLQATWHHQGLGVHSTCFAFHGYIPAPDGGQIKTHPAIASITVTEIDNMQNIQPLSPVTCSYQGTIRSGELSSDIEQTLTFDFYINETDHELLSMDKIVLASNLHFTDGEILGVWEDTIFSREFRINRYSGASTLSIRSVSEDSDTSYNSSSGECIAHTERKF